MNTRRIDPGARIGIQHRMANRDEWFIRRVGRAAGLPVVAGRDCTRVASHHPWTCLNWLTTGQTVGGTPAAMPEHPLTRQPALRPCTHGSAWFSREAKHNVAVAAGQFADLPVLSDHYLTCPAEQMHRAESELTVCGTQSCPPAGEPRLVAGWSIRRLSHLSLRGALAHVGHRCRWSALEVGPRLRGLTGLSCRRRREQTERLRAGGEEQCWTLPATAGPRCGRW